MFFSSWNSFLSKILLGLLLLVFSFFLVKAANRQKFVHDELITMRAAANKYPAIEATWGTLSEFKRSFEVSAPYPSFSEIKSGLAANDIHPPLYFFIAATLQAQLKNWGFTFLLINFFCILAIGYLATREFESNQSSHIFYLGVGILLCSPHIFVSLPAGRQIFLFAVFLTGFISFLLSYLKNGGRSIVGVTATTFLMLFTYYAAVFYLFSFLSLLILLSFYFWNTKSNLEKRRCGQLILAIAWGGMAFCFVCPEFFEIFRGKSQDSLSSWGSEIFRIRFTRFLTNATDFYVLKNRYSTMELFFYLNAGLMALVGLLRSFRGTRSSLTLICYALPLLVYFSTFVILGPNHGAEERYYVPAMASLMCGAIHIWGRLLKENKWGLPGLLALIPFFFIFKPALRYDSHYVINPPTISEITSKDVLFTTTSYRGIFGLVANRINSDPAVIDIQTKNVDDVKKFITELRPAIYFYKEQPWFYSEVQKNRLHEVQESLLKAGYHCETSLGEGVVKLVKTGC